MYLQINLQPSGRSGQSRQLAFHSRNFRSNRKKLRRAFYVQKKLVVFTPTGLRGKARKKLVPLLRQNVEKGIGNIRKILE
jgi:hypothetical protein